MHLASDAGEHARSSSMSPGGQRAAAKEMRTEPSQRLDRSTRRSDGAKTSASLAMGRAKRLTDAAPTLPARLPRLPLSYRRGEGLGRPNSMATNQQSAQIRDYVWLLRRRKWEILIVAALTVAATMFITLRETKIYEGQAKVLVNAVQDPNSSAGAQTPDLPTEQQVVESSAVAAIVRRSHHLTMSTKSLLSDLKVTPVPNTAGVLSIAYDSPSPAFAASAANAFATAYVKFRGGEVARTYQAAAATTQAQLTALQRNLARLDRRISRAINPATKSALQGQRDSMVAPAWRSPAAALDATGWLGHEPERLHGCNSARHRADLSDSATGCAECDSRRGRRAVPRSLARAVQASPRHSLQESTRIRTRARRARARRSAARFRVARAKRLAGPCHESSESSCRGLPHPCHKPRYAATEHGIRSVLVTSAVRDEGKSTVSANLASAMAQAGVPVLLISADLRRPSLHSFFGVPNDGIVDVVTGSRTLKEVLKAVDPPNLRFIGSGPAPRDPAALLGGQQAARLFGAVRATDTDFVVIDAPPALAVADTSILSQYVDAVLYVVDARRTTRHAVVQARDQLKTAHATVIGGVYNNFDRRSNYSGEYDPIGYYESYARTDESIAVNGSRDHGHGRWSRFRPRKGTDTGPEESTAAVETDTSTPELQNE